MNREEVEKIANREVRPIAMCLFMVAIFAVVGAYFSQNINDRLRLLEKPAPNPNEIGKPTYTTADDGAIYFQLQGHSFYSLPKGAFMEMAVFHSAGCPCYWIFSTNSVKSSK